MNIDIWLRFLRNSTCTNKRPMGHIAHLRKQFKSINTYDYIITIKRKNHLLLYENLIFLHLNLHPGMHCASLIEISPAVLEKIFKFCLCIFAFVIISPWKKVGPFIWTHLNPLYPRMHCAKFGWNWPSGSWEEVENRKSLQTDGQTDDGRQAIRKANLSFQLRWAKKSIAWWC